MRFSYPVELRNVSEGPPEDHCVLVSFPDVPEAMTFGKDRGDALRSAEDCLEVALAGRIRERHELPLPSAAHGRPTVSPGSLIAQKAALYLALRESGLRAADLARLLDTPPPAVQRLLDPKHASKPDQFDAAFRALGKRVVICLESAA